MTVLANNGNALYQGLSDFWLRLFADTADLQALYQGSSVLLGQAYLDLMSSVLNTNLLEVPLFRREYYRLITMRQDRLTYADTGIFGQARYRVDTGAYLAAVPALQNTVYAAKGLLSPVIDYDVVDGQLAFIVDPTSPPVDGFGYRTLEVAIAGTFSATGQNWVTVGVQPGDSLLLEGYATPLRVCVVTEGALVLDASTPIPKVLAAGYAWTVERTLTTGAVTILAASTALDGSLMATRTYTVNEVAFWAVDALIDEQALYNYFGYLAYPARKTQSSEVYRTFLRGIIQLYLFGPSIGRVESALNLIANLPVVSNDGEVLLGYDDGVVATGTDGVLSGDVFSSASHTFTSADVGGYMYLSNTYNGVNTGKFQIAEFLTTHSVLLTPGTSPFVAETGITWTNTLTDAQTVTTSGGTYAYPFLIPIRDDVKDVGNVGVLTFTVFEPLSAAVKLTDYVEDPQWWRHIVIPQELLPDYAQSRRAVSPDLYPNIIGDDSNGGLCVGDPGFYIGADTLGNVVTHPYHHTAAFVLMDQFLKFNMFSVTLDQHIDVSGMLIAEMQGFLRNVKPAATFVYFAPHTSQTETVTVSETLTAEVIYRLFEDFNVYNNELRIDGTWNIGDRWHYTSTSGTGVATGVSADDMNLAIGGSNPFLTPPAGQGVYDQALHVKLV